MKKIIFLLILFSAINLASALSINSVDTPVLTPGEEGTIKIQIKNELNKDVQDISLSLKFENLPFIPIGTSEHFLEELESDEDEDFFFRIKASSAIKPGDYEVPYILNYFVNDDEKTREGTLGIKVTAEPDLVFSISTQTPVKDQKGKIILKIINKGLADAKFVSIKVLPEGFTLLSEREAYIDEIASNDFETTDFDVIFKETNANFEAIVEHRDFDNTPITQTVNLPITVYSQEKAEEIGIIQKNKTATYVVAVVVIIILFIVWRTWRKRRRIRRSKELGEKI